MRGAVEHSLVLSEDIWLPECRWLLTSLDRRSENVRVPIVIAELEGERGIIALSTNPRSMPSIFGFELGIARRPAGHLLD
jgi:hypothetical protein